MESSIKASKFSEAQLAIIAVARRLLVRVKAMMKNGICYQP